MNSSTTETTNQDTRSIVVEYDLPHPVEKVWRALTDSKIVASWLMPNDLQPVVGHRFTFRTTPMAGWDGVCHCEVLEVEVNERLSYTWRGGKDDPKQGGSRLDTVVTWTLTRTASGGTLLRLVHSGFTPQNVFAQEMMNKGWRSKVAERMVQAIASIAD